MIHKPLLLLFSHSVVSSSLWPHGLQHTRLPLSFTISQSLLKLMSVESVMPSNHLILRHPLLLLSIFPRIRVFSNDSALLIRWPKYWSFSLKHQSFQWISELISFRIDWLDLLVVQGTLESSSAPQNSKVSSSVLSCLYGSTLTFERVSWKNHSFDYMDICRQSDVSAF